MHSFQIYMGQYKKQSNSCSQKFQQFEKKIVSHSTLSELTKLEIIKGIF